MKSLFQLVFFLIAYSLINGLPEKHVKPVKPKSTTSRSRAGHNAPSDPPDPPDKNANQNAADDKSQNYFPFMPGYDDSSILKQRPFNSSESRRRAVTKFKRTFPPHYDNYYRWLYKNVEDHSGAKRRENFCQQQGLTDFDFSMLLKSTPFRIPPRHRRYFAMVNDVERQLSSTKHHFWRSSTPDLYHINNQMDISYLGDHVRTSLKREDFWEQRYQRYYPFTPEPQYEQFYRWFFKENHELNVNERFSDPYPKIIPFAVNPRIHDVTHKSTPYKIPAIYTVLFAFLDDAKLDNMTTRLSTWPTFVWNELSEITGRTTTMLPSTPPSTEYPLYTLARERKRLIGEFFNVTIDPWYEPFYEWFYRYQNDRKGLKIRIQAYENLTDFDYSHELSKAKYPVPDKHREIWAYVHAIEKQLGSTGHHYQPRNPYEWTYKYKTEPALIKHLQHWFPNTTVKEQHRSYFKFLLEILTSPEYHKAIMTEGAKMSTLDYDELLKYTPYEIPSLEKNRYAFMAEAKRRLDKKWKYTLTTPTMPTIPNTRTTPLTPSQGSSQTTTKAVKTAPHKVPQKTLKRKILTTLLPSSPSATPLTTAEVNITKELSKRDMLDHIYLPDTLINYFNKDIPPHLEDYYRWLYEIEHEYNSNHTRKYNVACDIYDQIDYTRLFKYTPYAVFPDHVYEFVQFREARRLLKAQSHPTTNKPDRPDEPDPKPAMLDWFRFTIPPKYFEFYKWLFKLHLEKEEYGKIVQLSKKLGPPNTEKLLSSTPYPIPEAHLNFWAFIKLGFDEYVREFQKSTVPTLPYQDAKLAGSHRRKRRSVNNEDFDLQKLELHFKRSIPPVFKKYYKWLFETHLDNNGFLKRHQMASKINGTLNYEKLLTKTPFPIPIGEENHFAFIQEMERRLKSTGHHAKWYAQNGDLTTDMAKSNIFNDTNDKLTSTIEPDYQKFYQWLENHHIKHNKTLKDQFDKMKSQKSHYNFKKLLDSTAFPIPTTYLEYYAFVQENERRHKYLSEQAAFRTERSKQAYAMKKTTKSLSLMIKSTTQTTVQKSEQSKPPLTTSSLHKPVRVTEQYVDSEYSDSEQESKSESTSNTKSNPQVGPSGTTSWLQKLQNYFATVIEPKYLKFYDWFYKNQNDEEGYKRRYDASHKLNVTKILDLAENLKDTPFPIPPQHEEFFGVIREIEQMMGSTDHYAEYYTKSLMDLQTESTSAPLYTIMPKEFLQQYFSTQFSPQYHRFYDWLYHLKCDTSGFHNRHQGIRAHHFMSVAPNKLTNTPFPIPYTYTKYFAKIKEIEHLIKSSSHHNNWYLSTILDSSTPPPNLSEWLKLRYTREWDGNPMYEKFYQWLHEVQEDREGYRKRLNASKLHYNVRNNKKNKSSQRTPFPIPSTYQNYFSLVNELEELIGSTKHHAKWYSSSQEDSSGEQKIVTKPRKQLLEKLEKFFTQTIDPTYLEYYNWRYKLYMGEISPTIKYFDSLVLANMNFKRLFNNTPFALPPEGSAELWYAYHQQMQRMHEVTEPLKQMMRLERLVPKRTTSSTIDDDIQYDIDYPQTTKSLTTPSYYTIDPVLMKKLQTILSSTFEPQYQEYYKWLYELLLNEDAVQARMRALQDINMQEIIRDTFTPFPIHTKSAHYFLHVNKIEQFMKSTDHHYWLKRSTSSNTSPMSLTPSSTPPVPFKGQSLMKSPSEADMSTVDQRSIQLSESFSISSSQQNNFTSNETLPADAVYLDSDTSKIQTSLNVTDYKNKIYNYFQFTYEPKYRPFYKWLYQMRVEKDIPMVPQLMWHFYKFDESVSTPFPIPVDRQHEYAYIKYLEQHNFETDLPHPTIPQRATKRRRKTTTPQTTKYEDELQKARSYFPFEWAPQYNEFYAWFYSMIHKRSLRDKTCGKILDTKNFELIYLNKTKFPVPSQHYTEYAMMQYMDELPENESAAREEGIDSQHWRDKEAAKKEFYPFRWQPDYDQFYIWLHKMIQKHGKPESTDPEFKNAIDYDHAVKHTSFKIPLHQMHDYLYMKWLDDDKKGGYMNPPYITAPPSLLVRVNRIDLEERAEDYFNLTESAASPYIDYYIWMYEMLQKHNHFNQTDSKFFLNINFDKYLKNTPFKIPPGQNETYAKMRFYDEAFNQDIEKKSNPSQNAQVFHRPVDNNLLREAKQYFRFGWYPFYNEFYVWFYKKVKQHGIFKKIDTDSFKNIDYKAHISVTPFLIPPEYLNDYAYMRQMDLDSDLLSATTPMMSNQGSRKKRQIEESEAHSNFTGQTTELSISPILTSHLASIDPKYIIMTTIPVNWSEDPYFPIDIDSTIKSSSIHPLTTPLKSTQLVHPASHSTNHVLDYYRSLRETFGKAPICNTSEEIRQVEAERREFRSLVEHLEKVTPLITSIRENPTYSLFFHWLNNENPTSPKTKITRPLINTPFPIPEGYRKEYAERIGAERDEIYKDLQELGIINEIPQSTTVTTVDNLFVEPNTTIDEYSDDTTESGLRIRPTLEEDALKIGFIHNTDPEHFNSKEMYNRMHHLGLGETKLHSKITFFPTSPKFLTRQAFNFNALLKKESKSIEPKTFTRQTFDFNALMKNQSLKFTSDSTHRLLTSANITLDQNSTLSNHRTEYQRSTFTLLAGLREYYKSLRDTFGKAPIVNTSEEARQIQSEREAFRNEMNEMKRIHDEKKHPLQYDVSLSERIKSVKIPSDYLKAYAHYTGAGSENIRRQLREMGYADEIFNYSTTIQIPADDSGLKRVRRAIEIILLPQETTTKRVTKRRQRVHILRNFTFKKRSPKPTTTNTYELMVSDIRFKAQHIQEYEKYMKKLGLYFLTTILPQYEEFFQWYYRRIREVTYTPLPSIEDHSGTIYSQPFYVPPEYTGLFSSLYRPYHLKEILTTQILENLFDYYDAHPNFKHRGRKIKVRKNFTWPYQKKLLLSQQHKLLSTTPISIMY